MSGASGTSQQGGGHAAGALGRCVPGGRAAGRCGPRFSLVAPPHPPLEVCSPVGSSTPLPSGQESGTRLSPRCISSPGEGCVVLRCSFLL